MCLKHYKQWRRTVDELPNATVPPGALTAAEIAVLGEVTVETVHNWQGLGRIPPPDGHASGRSWWWLERVTGVNRRRRPSTPRPNKPGQ